MSRKEAGCKVKDISHKKRWRTYLSISALAVFVIGACLVVRSLERRSGATAQSPLPSSSTAAASSTQNEGGGAPSTAMPDITQLRTMAVVNGEEISRQMLSQECFRRYGEEVLENMVNKYLISEECRKHGISITVQDVEDEVDRVAQQFGLSTDRWLGMLQEERDISPSRYRREIIWPMLALRHLAKDRITVSDEEIEMARESQYGPSVQALVIAVADEPFAHQIRAEAVAHPEEFGNLAKDHSEDRNSAAQRGMIPPIRHHAGFIELEEAAFALEEGEISPVTFVANQYVIVKCVAHVPETYIAPEYRESVMQRLREGIEKHKLREVAADIFRELQETANVENVFNNDELRQRMPGVAATVNNQPITVAQVSEEALRRHGHEVLDGEIHRIVLVQALQQGDAEVLGNDIDAELARAAMAYGYVDEEGNADIDAWVEHVTSEDGVTVDMYIRDAVWPSVALKKLVVDSVEISEEDIQRGFEANYGERVEVLAVVLSDARLANDVWEMARNNPTEEFFGQLATQYSIEPVSKNNAGLVPPVRRWGGQPHIEEEAFNLQPGEVSGVIAVRENYIILHCLGRTETITDLSLEDVQEELLGDIREKKLRIAMSQEFERLLSQARIDNYVTGESRSPRRPAHQNAQGLGAVTR